MKKVNLRIFLRTDSWNVKAQASKTVAHSSVRVIFC